MSYLKRWRKIRAATAVEACTSSSDEDEISFSNINAVSDDVDHVIQSSDNTSYYEVPEYVSSSDESDQTVDHSDDQTAVSSLKDRLANWKVKHYITRCAFSDLLMILRGCGHDLPKDARTILKTPRTVSTVEKCGGQVVHFGLKRGIADILAQVDEKISSVKLLVNVDGLPLFKSSGMEFWPIMCSFDNYCPFVVALYCGYGKPKCVYSFLEQFLEEYKEMQEKGIDFHGASIQVTIRAFVCDAPARAFLKGIKGHTAYDACERCVVKGKKKDFRTVFSFQPPHPLRNGDNFAAFHYKDHQVQISPLVKYNIPCISTFPLDYMHLVCLGVVRRMLHFWKNGPRNCRLSQLQLKQLSDRLCRLNGQFPSEFARQPRTLMELDRWKATELRQFLLYSGPVVLKKIIDEKAYELFLALSVAISIMLNSDSHQRMSYLDFARQLLNYFVHKSGEIFGEIFVVYNVHGLVHLHEDVENFDCSLNELSAFPFENYMQKLKRLVRHGNSPLSQVFKRMVEAKIQTGQGEVLCNANATIVSPKQRDCCFMLTTGDIAFVRSSTSEGLWSCAVAKKCHFESFFASPCESNLVGIVYVKDKYCNKYRVVPRSELCSKLVCLSHGDGHVMFPLLHEAEKKP